MSAAVATTREDYARAAINASLSGLDAELRAARVDRDLSAMLDAVNAVEADLARLEVFAEGVAR